MPSTCNQGIHFSKSSLMTSSMSSAPMLSQMATPSYFLYRAGSVGDSFDPTAAIQFYPAKDSDELFDALRVAYPGTKTHSERMRDAVIDFLMKERTDEQAKNNMAATPSTWSSWPSNSSHSSNLSSPDLIDLATPSSVTSPMPSMSRQPSRSSTGRASLEQMTGVFSLSNSSQPKTRIRRKMTDSEKAEYRKRRIVKACAKCSKSKRKCDHNQEQMEVLAPLSSGRITKKKSPPSSANSIRQVEATPPPSSAFDLDTLSFLNDDSLFSFDAATTQASTSNDANLNLMDFDFGQQTEPAAAWPWSDTQDWTLLDAQPTHSSSHTEPLFGEVSVFAGNSQPPQHVPGTHFNLDVFTTQQAATHTWHTHAAQKPASSDASFMGISDHLPRDQDLLGDEDVSPGASFDVGGSTGPAGPTRSKRHYGGFDRSAFLGDSQTASHAEAITHATVDPGRTVLQSQVLHSGASSQTFGLEQADTSTRATTASARAGRTPPDVPKPDLQPIRNRTVMSVSMESKRAHFNGEESAAEHGRDFAYNSVGQRAAELAQEITKNKGPGHATRKSAAMGGDSVGGKRQTLPLGLLDGQASQLSSAPTLAQYVSAEQFTAERASSTGSGASRGGYAAVAPAFAHGQDFSLADSRSINASMSACSSSTASSGAGLTPVLPREQLVVYEPVHTRGRSPRSPSAAGSHMTNTSLAMSARAIHRQSLAETVGLASRERVVGRLDGKAFDALVPSTSSAMASTSSGHVEQYRHKTSRQGDGRLAKASLTQVSASSTDESFRHQKHSDCTSSQGDQFHADGYGQSQGPCRALAAPLSSGMRLVHGRASLVVGPRTSSSFGRSRYATAAYANTVSSRWTNVQAAMAMTSTAQLSASLLGLVQSLTAEMLESFSKMQVARFCDAFRQEVRNKRCSDALKQETRDGDVLSGRRAACV